MPFLNKTGLEADLREFSLESEQNHLKMFQDCSSLDSVLGAAGMETAEDENLTAELCQGRKAEQENQNLLCRGLQIYEINQEWPNWGIFSWQSQNVHQIGEHNVQNEGWILHPAPKSIKCTQQCLNSHSQKKNQKPTYSDFEAELSGMHQMQKELRRNTIWIQAGWHLTKCETFV